MILVLSPAKTLNFEPHSRTKKHTLPAFLDDSQELIDQLAEMSPTQIAKLMGISDKLAELNVARFRSWELPFQPENAKQAVLAFQGDVYQGLQCDAWKAKEFTFAQKHLRILSGLYGVLRPLDLMQPYRLEMGTKLKTQRGKNLYAFWGEAITDAINLDLLQSRSQALINLASNEYFDVLQPGSLAKPVVTPVFKDEKNGKFKIISFFAKRARGMMANYIIQNKIKTPEALKDFSDAGYYFDDSSSTESQLVFLRNQQ